MIRKLKFGAGALVLLAVCSCSEKETVTLETTTATLGEITEYITATGTVESITQVDVGTQVTGTVASLYADFNSEVKAGDLIAEIDKTALLASLESADATMESARLTYELNKKNYRRDSALYAKELISEYEYDSSLNEYLVSKASYEKSQSDRVTAVRNLSYAEITAPIDGIVVSREVEVGQTVVSSMSVANLYVIADLDKMQVVADVDEADIGSVKVGQNASFTVDAYPDDTFSGIVTQVRINPTTESNVVTYEVLISTENPEHKLIPGLTANITVYTKEAKDVITVPIKTLKFQPLRMEGLPEVASAPEPKNGVENRLSEEALNGEEGEMAPPPTEGTEPQDPLIATEDMHRLLWVLNKDNQLVPTEVEIGIDNGVNVAILDGLSVGDKVALQYTTSSGDEDVSTSSSEGSSNPFMPGPPDRNKKSKEKSE